MAIMTGIKSAQIMGPNGHREASREAARASPALAEKPRMASVRGVTGGSIIDQIL
jgi:hypothetical protein